MDSITPSARSSTATLASLGGSVRSPPLTHSAEETIRGLTPTLPPGFTRRSSAAFRNSTVTLTGTTGPVRCIETESQLPYNGVCPLVEPRMKRKRWFLLALFSAAQFIDIYSASAVVVGLTEIAEAYNMTIQSSVWIINGYALTLAAFLLTGGRIADISSPKWVFIAGFSLVGIFSLGVPFTKNAIAMIVLRAASGVGAALTIPAALNLIVHIFPEEKEQALAIAIFGGCGAIANVMGLLIGGVLLLASWKWIFWFITLASLPLSIIGIFLIPGTPPPAAVDLKEGEKAERLPRMDYVGGFLQVAAIVLLVYGLTTANVNGWSDPGVLSTVIISLVLLFPAFFWWQTRLPHKDALIMPSMWTIKNFLLLNVISLGIYQWWFLVQVAFASVLELEWGYSPILTAVHFLPIGIAGGSAIVLGGAIPPKLFPLRWRLVSGSVLSAGGALMLAFAHTKHDYWRLCFPAFIIGSAGTGLVFVSANVSLMLSVPPETAGVAGGVFNSALQLGTAICLSIANTIQVAYPISPGSFIPSARGYKNSFFFCVAVMLLCGLLALIFFVDPLETIMEPVEDQQAGMTVEEKKKGLPTAAAVIQEEVGREE